MKQAPFVTDIETPFPSGKILVSKTDLTSLITYANDAFVELSGYAVDELVGSAHNMVRHPDMPAVVFRDMWETLKAGRPWRGVVKNRRKDGGFYWVDALVVPIRKGGQPVGYMSVRTEPKREAVDEAARLYRSLRQSGATFSSRPPLLRRASMAAVGGSALAAMAALFIAQTLLVAFHGTTTASLALGVFGVVLCALLAAYGARCISRPLRTAVKVFQRIAEGRLDNVVDVAGRSEVGSVFAELAAMQVQLRVVVDEIRLAETAVAQRSHELDTALGELTSRSRKQQDSVIGVTSAMEEVSVSISEVAHSAGVADKTTREVGEIIDAGERNMAQSLASADSVVDAMAQTNSTIAELSRAIGEIGQITQVIKAIAGQTNLLALNAAIEAARAGESGRGFAVVADEVRSLAERTAVSTEQIASMIGSVQASTENTVQAMQNTAAAVTSVREHLTATGESFGRIVSTNSDVLTQTSQIALATREQSVAGEDIARNMERIATVIDDNVRTAGEVKHATSELLARADALHGIVRFFD
ncbi:MAG: PAS domain-containing methyl-accepting chemotaxis protein [Rhodocyclaceae bacterium]